MNTSPIKTLFANNIARRIEEVIKVDQTDEEILREEIGEYVVTDSIRRHYTDIYEKYKETPNKPHEGIAIWVSGFFGSGKSSFAKMLGLSIADRPVVGDSAAKLFAARIGDDRAQVLLGGINEQIPTHAVIFDVSTDRGIRSGNQTLTEIMYGLFLQSLGYAKDLDLSELEIALEDEPAAKGKTRLDAFKDTYRKIYDKEWDSEKGKVAFALSEASRVLHSMDPATYPMADSWVKAVRNKADITPGKLAERANELMKRRRPKHNLMFVIDEVGQFVARDVQKMLDLQAVVQSLGVKGRGRHWVVVTSQEKLGELVSGLDDKKIEIARLMDRFPLQVHLEPSDISEVTSQRVLSKNAGAETTLGNRFDENRARLTENTRLTADIRLPELTREGFIDLYPLLPYHIDLVIQVVSGLRTQGGASKHVGGANRTIIKLAQQLLINPAVNLAEQEIGALARIDQIYDLVEGNIASEVRAKIAKIAKEVDHPLAQPVAKAICLLQYVKSIHRTAENIAAALHPAIGADSQLAAVKEALEKLEATHNVRRGDDGYRIPTPAEDDWERARLALLPKPGDAHRLQSETLVGFWQPQPSHNLFDTKTFKAGLSLRGREQQDGDLLFDFYLAEGGKEHSELLTELRSRSQVERKTVFWGVALSDAIDRETIELHRSKEMLSRKERDARTGDETALIVEEKDRLRRHQDGLRRLLRAACLAGTAYFRGNDRSRGDKATDVGRAAAEVLGEVLPLVFDRYKDAAARSSDLKKGMEALGTAENLNGLPSLFSSLSLLRDEKGKPVFRTDTTPLVEVMSRIEEKASYGDIASGRYLVDDLAKEPFGWDFEAVRLFVLCLLRAGKIEATSKGQTIDSALGVESKDLFGNNNTFKQAAFRPRKGIEFAELVKAAEAFKDTFGGQVKELSAGTVAQEIRRELRQHEQPLADTVSTLKLNALPGAAPLDTAWGQVREIERGSDENAVASFNSAHRSIKEAIRRVSDLEPALTEPRLYDLAHARRILDREWTFLEREPDLDAALRNRATALADLLARETFFRELAAIDQHAHALEEEHAKRYQLAVDARQASYEKALVELANVPGWANLDDAQKEKIAEPLRRGAAVPLRVEPIPQIRAETEACDSRLRVAVQALARLLEGERIVSVSVGSYFSGGVETEEQLDAALSGVREECVRLIGAGKKVLIQ